MTKPRKKHRKKPPTTIVSVRMDDAFLARLQRTAKTNERSVGAEIRMILKAYLDGRESEKVAK